MIQRKVIGCELSSLEVAGQVIPSASLFLTTILSTEKITIKKLISYCSMHRTKLEEVSRVDIEAARPIVPSRRGYMDFGESTVIHLI